MLIYAGCTDSGNDADGQHGSNNGGSGENGGSGNNGGSGENGGSGNNGGSGDEDLPQTGGACGEITNSGKCFGNLVYYCDENHVLQSYDCTQDSQVCGELSDETHTWYACTEDTHGGEASDDLKTAEDWARARIAGKVSTEAAFYAISEGSGFPVVTDDQTVIFMHWYEGGQWSVTGDFNQWQYQAMTQSGDIWYAEVAMPEEPVQKNYYKFHDGSQDVADPWSQRYTYTEHGEISYIVAPDAPYLMRWPGFKSPQGLAARTVRAYVPKGEGPFDILYAHDGQNLFGPGGAYGSWKVEENMVKAEASFIVVGIDNGGDARLSEYAFADDDLTSFGYGYITARGADYAQFVHETVRPFIEARFAHTTKAGLMGSSMGGLISLYIAHLYPTAYDVVLALSPTTAWGRFSRSEGQTIEDLYAKEGHRAFTLYLDNGGYAPEGGCPSVLTSADAADDENNLDCYCFTRSFVDKMDELGYTWEQDLYHYYDPGAAHNEAAWAARLAEPLKLFKNK